MTFTVVSEQILYTLQQEFLEKLSLYRKSFWRCVGCGSEGKLGGIDGRVLCIVNNLK